MKTNCPGAGNISGTPTLKLKTCPDCGGEIELFSSEVQSACRTCGFVAFNNIISCIRWCKAARECVGDEMYELLMGNTGNPLETAEQPLAQHAE